MFLFNLSLVEFMGLLTAVSGLVFALYLLDRSRRRVVVATLRFWNVAQRPVESTQRRRIKQWPSLLLQLISLACLLLAIAQLRWGSPDRSSRDHVLVLDTSSWMAARSGNTTLMELSRRQALAYLDTLPSTDRVMVVYADALATPVTAFDDNRRNLQRAVRNARPSNASLDLAQALDFSRQALARNARRPGEVVYAGAGRFANNDSAESMTVPQNMRVLPVSTSPENVGIRKIGLRRSGSESGLWQILVIVRNYGLRPQQADLGLQFAGAPLGARSLQLPPSSEQEAVFDLRSKSAGLLEARIRVPLDSFSQDDRAILEVPPLPNILITVCSAQPDQIRPLLDSHPNVRATYLTPDACQKPPASGVYIFDGMAPVEPVQANAVFLDPPAGRSPIPVRTTVRNVSIQRWRSDHPLAAGLHAQDLHLDQATLFDTPAGSERIAESAQGPVIVSRDANSVRTVVFGFHPMHSAMRYELAVPVLFANVLRWLAPASFDRLELYAESVGTVTVEGKPGADPAAVKVTSADGAPVPYSISGDVLRFFTTRPGTVRVLTPEGEQLHSLVLPNVPDTGWKPPSSVRRGLPAAREAVASSSDLWYWLAIAGGLGLLAEWLLFAPASRRRTDAPASLSASAREAFRRAS